MYHQAFAFAAYDQAYRSDPAVVVPTALRTLLTAAYQELAVRTQQMNPPVAVRSSAIREDGKAASFAGQYETYLNIVGAEALCQAVTRCWASAQSARVSVYRQQQGEMATTGPIAVLVQQLIAADVAVVAFSANPVRGSREQIMINATWDWGKVWSVAR